MTTAAAYAAFLTADDRAAIVAYLAADASFLEACDVLQAAHEDVRRAVRNVYTQWLAVSALSDVTMEEVEALEEHHEAHFGVAALMARADAARDALDAARSALSAPARAALRDLSPDQLRRIIG